MAQEAFEQWTERKKAEKAQKSAQRRKETTSILDEVGLHCAACSIRTPLQVRASDIQPAAIVEVGAARTALVDWSSFSGGLPVMGAAEKTSAQRLALFSIVT